VAEGDCAELLHEVYARQNASKAATAIDCFIPNSLRVGDAQTRISSRSYVNKFGSLRHTTVYREPSEKNQINHR
jgi:hypothetical protein